MAGRKSYRGVREVGIKCCLRANNERFHSPARTAASRGWEFIGVCVVSPRMLVCDQKLAGAKVRIIATAVGTIRGGGLGWRQMIGLRHIRKCLLVLGLPNSLLTPRYSD